MTVAFLLFNTAAVAFTLGRYTRWRSVAELREQVDWDHTRSDVLSALRPTKRRTPRRAT